MNDAADGATIDPARWHPRLHFVPPRHWMNDPNGLVRCGDAWRLYFQYADDPPDYRRVHWGTATSPDLLRWRFEGIALEGTRELCRYSGSVLPPATRDGEPVAFHTAHRSTAAGERRQTQEIAYGRDRGRVLVPGATTLIDERLADFRDPYVFAHDGGLAMVVAEPVGWSAWATGARSRLAIYRGDAAEHWTRTGELGPWDAPAVMWEVPWLAPVALPGREPGWVLALSTVDRTGDGVRCGTRYWLGDFDGASFRVLPGTGPQTLDHGPDYYAPIPEADARALAPGAAFLTTAWVGNWAYARRLPVSPWAGGPLALPRRVDVVATPRGPRLRQRLLPELESLAAAPAVEGAEHVGTTPRAPALPDAPFLLDLHWELLGAEAATLTLFGGAVTVALEESGASISLERGDQPTGLGLAGRWRAERPAPSPDAHLRIVVDRCVVAVYADDGRVPFTALVLARGEPAEARLAARGGHARARWRALPLRPIVEVA